MEPKKQLKDDKNKASLHIIPDDRKPHGYNTRSKVGYVNIATPVFFLKESSKPAPHHKIKLQQYYIKYVQHPETGKYIIIQVIIFDQSPLPRCMVELAW